MRCNNCGGRVCVPVPEALVPALGCEDCGRLVPVTGVRHPKPGRGDLKRALRAHRRKQMRRELADAAE